MRDRDFPTKRKWALYRRVLLLTKSVYRKLLDKEVWLGQSLPEWSVRSANFARFLQPRSQAVMHLVFLRPSRNAPEVEDYLKKLVSRFIQNRETLKMDSISLKRRCDVAVSDARYAAPLLRCQEFDYVLICTFVDRLTLSHYYEHELHSIERENLYVLLNPGIKAKFAAASRLNEFQKREKAALFSEIEQVMVESGFIFRVDLGGDAPHSSDV